MAKTKPAFYARVRQEEGSEYFHNIGVAFPFKDGDGYVVKLTLLPTNFDGTFILVPPKDGE